MTTWRTPAAVSCAVWASFHFPAPPAIARRGEIDGPQALDVLLPFRNVDGRTADQLWQAIEHGLLVWRQVCQAPRAVRRALPKLFPREPHHVEHVLSLCVAIRIRRDD